MNLREAISESYHNAASDDPTIKASLDAMTPEEFAMDLWWKSGVIDNGKWGVKEIAAEIAKMREEKLLG